MTSTIDTGTTSTVARSARPSYGNWVRLRSAGLFGTGLAATVVLFATPVLALFGLMVAGLPAVALIGLLGAFTFLCVGTPLGPAVTRRVLFQRHVARGGHLWRSGIFSPNRDRGVTLPGMAGRLELLEYTDPTGQPFAVVYDRRRGGLWTLILRADADGPAMVEAEQVDTWVAGWSRFLATAGTDPALLACKVVVDTAPDPGTGLAAAVAAAQAPSAPALAVAVMSECADRYPALAAANATWIELTYRGRALARQGDRDAQREAVLAELGRHLPGLVQSVTEAGGGAVTPATVEDLTRAVRSAYDPATVVDGDVAWADAGPVAAQEAWDVYRHDGGWSVSWEMHDAPRAGIDATALAHLMAPQAGLVRKRVALMLRPHSPDGSARAAENDAATATFNATSAGPRGRVPAAAALRVRATEQARHEVATGAVLVRFNLLVTATVTHRDDLDQAVASVESAAGSVPLRLRRCLGSQAAAFATTLPVGFVPSEHTVIPEKLRDLL
jgi:hypothetical protein